MKNGACPGMKGLKFSGPADPGPGVADVERFQRMATRPPDAALAPDDAAQLDRIQRLVDECNRLRKEVTVLRAWLDQEREATGVREVVLAAELRAEHRDFRRATWLAVALFIGMVWREGYHLGMWIWRLL